MQNALTPDGELAISRFSAAACIYDSYAEHQRLIASDVLDIVSAFQPESLLELGCGTGILSSGLHDSFPDTLKVFTDGAAGMVEVCRNKIPESSLVQYETWNFEKAQCNKQYDLVVSSCALQWLQYPDTFVRSLSSMVTTGGISVHAIPVQGMLGELEQSFTQTGGKWNSLNYISGTEWNDMFFDSGFDVTNSFSRDFTVHYPSPVDALRAIRGIGASLSGHPGSSVVSPSILRNALENYQSEFGDNSGMVPATYRIHFVVAFGGGR